ncbi:DUF6527 family protein [Actibacterium sp. 188UL27-1]|uniref:DUF6527 family protein n=1 Tax=Actibacterium sp. 188UL27-1 TaxID=2786961 RepID=UPI00351C4819
MNAVSHLEPQFVTNAPRELDSGVLYVSIEYCTMLHLCACGCGRKVVTPLSPNDWNLTYNGKSITVRPSIGSWSLPCQSHYVIKNNKIVWAGQWSDEQIKKGRQRDLVRKRGRTIKAVDSFPDQPDKLERNPVQPNWLGQSLRWIRGRFR